MKTDEIKLSFSDWLIMLNPLTQLTITTENGMVYKGKKTEGLNFRMELSGIDINTFLKNNPL